VTGVQTCALPISWGHLGFAVIPELEHISELLTILYESTQTDPCAWVGIQDEKHCPRDFDRYTPGTDLRHYSFWHNKAGNYVNLIEVRIGDNGCLDSIPDHCGGSIKRDGNDEAFMKSQERCLQIKDFWKMLEDRVREYTIGKGFNHLDISKPEFR
jgi:hypothetical protein